MKKKGMDMKYKKGMKVKSPDEDQDPDEGYAEQDEKESMADKGSEASLKAKKSMTDIEKTDLEKSIEMLEEFAVDGSPVARKEVLLEKAKSGDLSEDEREELYKALGGESEEQEDSHITDGFAENETMQKALDVSDYLAEQQTELCKSLDLVGEAIEKSDKRQHEFSLILAKAVADTGNLVKAIAERLEVISGQPARAPKSAGIQGSKPMQKSFAGAQPEGSLSSVQILDGLDLMMEKSMKEGQDGRTSDGEDILKSISKYEQTHAISKSMLANVQRTLAEAAH